MEPLQHDDEKEKMKLENEIRKMKLELEKGAKFYENPDLDLNPELENEFLNYIEQYEKMHKDSPMISIFEKAGSPAFIPAGKIKSNEVEAELERILGILEDCGIELDTIHEVEPEELYRFVTEELFPHRMYDMKLMPGMRSHFIYEEFHPDDIKDIKACVLEFVHDLARGHNQEEGLYVSTDLSSGTWNWVDEFHAAYAELELKNLQLRSICISEGDPDSEAQATFEIDLVAGTFPPAELHHYRGLGHALLHDHHGTWQLTELRLPAAS